MSRMFISAAKSHYNAVKFVICGMKGRTNVDPPPKTIHPGQTAWMLLSVIALVLLDTLTLELSWSFP